MGASLHCLASAAAWGRHLLRASLTPSLSCKGPARMAAGGLEEGDGLCAPTHGSSGGTELRRGLEQDRSSWGCNAGG